jgi:hypothetical protein
MRADEVSRPSLLFFTYYRVVPTAQMGIFKRCLRLIRHLAGDFDIRLVNYGPLPEEDALFSEIRPLIELHDPVGELGEALVAIFEAVRPAAVIHGEAPLRGSMRLSHRIASAFELWQICIDNYHGEFLTSVLVSGWPTGRRPASVLGVVDVAQRVHIRPAHRDGLDVPRSRSDVAHRQDLGVEILSDPRSSGGISFAALVPPWQAADASLPRAALSVPCRSVS